MNLSRGMRTTAEPLDVGLSELVRVEERLALKVREAEGADDERVQRARARAAANDTTAALERAAEEEEQADFLEHGRALKALGTDSAARIDALDGVSSERIEELARRLVEELLRGLE